MANIFRVIANLATAFAQDVNQFVGGLNGSADIGDITAFPQITTLPTALTSSATGTGSLSGAYSYVVTYVTGLVDGTGQLHVKGETTPGTASTTVNASSQNISLTNIPIGPAGTIARNVYRTKAGGSTYYLSFQIADNATTSWTDTISDTALGAQAPTKNTTGSKFVGDGSGLTNLGLNKVGSKSYIQEVNGDFWLTANAYYDGSNWQRVDTSRYSFAVQMQGTNNIPNETIQGVNIWRCIPGTNPIGAMLTYGGWETCLIFTANENMVCGGMNFEMDGSGAATTYGRMNQLADGTYFSRNSYYDGANWQRDDITKSAMAIKVSSSGAITTLVCAAGSNPITWVVNNTLDDGSGNMNAAGSITPAKGIHNASVSESLLTTTSTTTIATYTPSTSGNFLIGTSVRVITAATTITLTINWTDATGAQTDTRINALSLATGTHDVPLKFINAVAGNSITVKATAGTANQSYISASILGV